MGLNSSMGRAADRNRDGVSSNLASANMFSCWLKTVLEIMISLYSCNFSEDDSDMELKNCTSPH